MVRRLYYFGLASLAVAGCSTSNYQQPVAQFASGASDVHSAFTSLSTEREQAVTQALAQTLLQPGTALISPQSCPADSNLPGQATSGSCTWTIIYPDRSTRSIQISHPEQDTLAFVGALDAYGQGLVQIATAQDVADLKAAVAKAGSAISTIAALAGPAAPIVPPIVKTVTTGGAWLFGKIADAERLRTLRDIVDAGAPAIDAAIPALKRNAVNIRSDILNSQRPLINSEMGQVGRLVKMNADLAISRTATQSTITDALTYDKIASSGLESVLDKMQAAYTSLRQGLNNPDVSFDDAVKVTADFAAEATTLVGTAKGSSGAK